MYTKVLTSQETEILDKYITQNYNEFHRTVFDHALCNTMPSWRGEMLANEEAYQQYVAKLQQPEHTK